MAVTPQRFVPKVHPATRAVEIDDPMTLHATPLPGDPEVMFRCVVEEYARMGCGAEEILALFRDPFYPALNALGERFGEAGVRERLAGVLRRTGVFCFQAAVSESPEPAAEPELVQLGSRVRLSATKGENHAEGL
jgi:hypothetical protein